MQSGETFGPRMMVSDFIFRCLVRPLNVIGALVKESEDQLPSFNPVMSMLKRINSRNINKCVFLCRSCATEKPTGSNKWSETALVKVQDRMYRWLDAYENFVGLTEVKSAQEQVTQAENKYREVQESRRAQQQQLIAVQARIKAVAMEVEKATRGTDEYVDWVTKENEIIPEEKAIVEKLTLSEANEKQYFSDLSSALRASHEKERARAERTKYWGIMGSIIGAAIAFCGTTINNYLRMKELRKLVSSSADASKFYHDQTVMLGKTVNQQYTKMEAFLDDIRVQLGQEGENIGPHSKPPGLKQDTSKFSGAKLEQILSDLKMQESNLEKEFVELKKLIVICKSDKNMAVENVVYVGPEVESMLKETERALEWKMKLQALGTVTLVYAAIAVTVPLVISFLKGAGS